MMATLIGICSKSCSCSEETRSLKGAQFFQITQREETLRTETTTCSGCDLFSRHLGLCALMARAHSSKNSHDPAVGKQHSIARNLHSCNALSVVSSWESTKGRPRWKIFGVKSLTARGTDCRAWSAVGIAVAKTCVCPVGHRALSLLRWVEESGTCSEFPAKSTVKISFNSCHSEKTSSSVPLESIPHLREDCRWGGYYPNIWLLICKQRIFFLLH